MTRTTWSMLLLALAAGCLAVYLGGLEPPRRRPDLEVSPQPAAAEQTPPIRVLLGGGDPRAFWTLRIEGPYRVTDDDGLNPGWNVLAQGPRLNEAVVVAQGDQIRIGEREFQAESVTIEPRDDGTIWLDGRRYRGRMRLFSLPLDAAGVIGAINILPLEDYLASVLPCEMPGDFPLAAQEAQAIAARTYALYQMKTAPAGRDFDLFDSVQSQAYGGMQYVDEAGDVWAVESVASRAIIEATRGVVLVYQGRFFCTYYSAVCGGATSDGKAAFSDAAPPLVQVACDFCSEGPHYRWTLELPRADVQRAAAEYVGRLGLELGELKSIEPEPTRLAGPPNYRLTGTADEAVLSATNFRLFVLGAENAFSARFTLTLDDQSLHVSGRGWGHGVGLCQWGARGLALKGRTGEEILAHYYPGSRLARIQ